MKDGTILLAYFNNKSTRMISTTHHGEFVDWATITYSQLVKELIKWETFHENMIEGTSIKKRKKDVCHYAIVLEVLFQNWFPLEGAKSHEKKKQAKQCQKDKRRKDNLMERFIKNKRPLNLIHIFPRKGKKLEIRTTRRVALMS